MAHEHYNLSNFPNIFNFRHLEIDPERVSPTIKLGLLSIFDSKMLMMQFQAPQKIYICAQYTSLLEHRTHIHQKSRYKL